MFQFYTQARALLQGNVYWQHVDLGLLLIILSARSRYEEDLISADREIHFCVIFIEKAKSWLMSHLLWYPFSILWSSEGVSEEWCSSDAAQTWEKEGEEEKEHKAAAAGPGTEPGPKPNPCRYHRPHRGHPHPAPAERNIPGPDGAASEDCYKNWTKDGKGKSSSAYSLLWLL